jgi:hypothetical protein
VDGRGEGGDQSMWSSLCVSLCVSVNSEEGVYSAWVDELVVEIWAWLCSWSVRTDERESS